MSRRLRVGLLFGICLACIAQQLGLPQAGGQTDAQQTRAQQPITASGAQQAAGQQSARGPQVFTFRSDIDDTDQPYALYIPKTYDASRRWPLVLSLHGPDSNHRLNLRRVFGRGNRIGENDAEASRYFPPLRDVDFLVASPLARGTMGYQGIAEKDVYDVVAAVKSRYSVDEDRVYLTGLSMGGGGALWLGLTRPDVWAAIAAVTPLPPPDTEALAGNALNVPVRLYQGALDPVVPVASVRAWAERFAKADVKHEYIEYPNVRHNAWDTAYRDASIFDWFQHRRVKFPERVRFAARDYEHSRAYWVRFDLLTPGTLAEFDGRFGKNNSFEVVTKQLEGFTLELDGNPAVNPSALLAVKIDGTQLRVKVQKSLSFSRTAKGWVARRAQPGADQKRPGAEGPIPAAISNRHVYVYGSEGAVGDDVSVRRDRAKYAADWSTPRSRLLVSFRALADVDVGPELRRSANLVLFGSRETNTIIAELDRRLPLALNPGAADYGLVYVYPVDGRYVVVNSGLPWWTRADQASRPGLPFLAAPYRALQSFGDYILFRGGLDGVIVEGRFDRNWKLPADAAERMRATGAVEVRR